MRHFPQNLGACVNTLEVGFFFWGGVFLQNLPF